jgi:hypothetical protein
MSAALGIGADGAYSQIGVESGDDAGARDCGTEGSSVVAQAEKKSKQVQQEALIGQL